MYNGDVMMVVVLYIIINRQHMSHGGRFISM